MHKGKTRAIARVWFDSPHLHTSQTPGFRWKPGVFCAQRELNLPGVPPRNLRRNCYTLGLCASC